MSAWKPHLPKAACRQAHRRQDRKRPGPGLGGDPDSRARRPGKSPPQSPGPGPTPEPNGSGPDGTWRGPRLAGLWLRGLIPGVLCVVGLVALIIGLALVGLIPGLVLLVAMLPLFLVTLRPDPHGQTPMQRLGMKLGWRRASYIVSTKFFWGLYDGANEKDTLNRKYLMQAIDGSLSRLGLDYVDLAFCHRSDPETPIAATVRALTDMITPAKVMFVGTSAWSAGANATACDVADRLPLTTPRTGHTPRTPAPTERRRSA